MSSSSNNHRAAGGEPGRGAFRTTARYDAVICDLDGCLAAENGGPIDLAGLAAIAEHNRRAWADRDRPMVTLCTGRPVAFVECMSRALANRLPVMAENGVWLWDPESGGSGEHERDPRISLEHLHALHTAQEWAERELVPLGVAIQPGKAASMSLYHPDHDLLHSLHERVAAAFGEQNLPFRVTATWFYLNCDLEFVSKTTAIERFCARTGIPRDRLAGIGDTMPDLKIRERVAWFACPANAKGELKPHCDYVAEQPMVDGVLEILGELGPRPTPPARTRAVAASG